MIKVALLNDTTFEYHHGCELVMNNIKYALLDRNVDIVAISKVGNNWKKDQDFLEGFEEADFSIINGEGTIHHNQATCNLLLDFAEFSFKKKKHCYLINSLIQGLSEENLKKVALFKGVWCRESKSANYLKSCNIKASVVPDLTFLSHPKLTNLKKSTSILVTDSVFIDLSEQLYKYTRENKFQFFPICQPFHILNYKKLRSYLSLGKAILLKLCFLVIKSFDIKVAYPTKRKSYYIKSPKKYIEKLAKSSFIISARFHSTCFAIKHQIPFVSLTSNSHKIEGLLEDIGLSSQKRIVTIHDLKKVNSEQLAYTKDEICLIEKYTTSAKIEGNYMFDQIIKEVRDQYDLIEKL